jgi:hypothetical protein
MTRRSGRGSDNDLHQEDLEAEAAATTTAIAGLRRRLKLLPGSLEHPSVRRELRKLADELAAHEDGKRRPGRHRSNVSRLPVRLAERAGQGGKTDDAEADHKPDPGKASTTADFIAALWHFRAWAGDPSWRKMAARSHYLAVHSTIYSAMHGTALPKLLVVKAIIAGCGGGDADLCAYIDAWWRIGSAGMTDTTANSGMLPAPVPALS